jgi:hypothetical protein
VGADLSRASSTLPDPKSVSHFPFFVINVCFAFPVLSFLQMFGRFSQLARHLSRPLPNYAHRSAASISGTMTSQSTDLGKRMIRTAGCIIIGDEVLGGKVQNMSRIAARAPDLTRRSIPSADNRYQFRLHGEMVLQPRYKPEKGRGHRRR